MSDRSSWTHIRTSNMRKDVRKGLEARIADPLWTLTRQWQMGEFEGDDAASPVRIKVTHASVNVNGLSSPRTPKSIYQPGRGDLIEPLIEAAEAEDGPARLRMSGEAGLQLLRLLSPKEAARARDALKDAFPLKPPSGLDAASQKVLRYLSRGSFDGFELRMEIAKNPAELRKYIESDAKRAEAIGKAWLAYMDDRFADQIGAGFWHDDRLEHRARVSARRGKSVDITLTADDHAGGRLEWHAFDVLRNGQIGNDAKWTGRRTNWLLPTPIAYSGMPAERFWDFEDGEVFFGGLTLEKTDLAQVILTEFATVYSNDWFMVPIPVETGTLTRIIQMEVFDTFGDKTVVKSCAENDGNARPWRFFELAGDMGPRRGASPLLYIPRSVNGGDHSRPVEGVTFVRDEMANLAWGIERLVESPAGVAVNRDQNWKTHRDQFPDYTGEGTTPEPTGDEEIDGAWTYRYLTTAPPHWVPFAPEVDGNLPTGRLVRSRMGEWDLLGAAKTRFAGPKGRLMDPSQPMVVEEEELLRGGIDVARRYESARTPDGRLLIWSSRTKRPAAREPSSGRETDVIRTKGTR